MNEVTNSDYLDLLAKCLAFSLWPEPLRPMSTAQRRGPHISLLKFCDRILSRVGVRLAIQPVGLPLGTYWPALAHTMIGPVRLQNIRDLCQRVESNKVPGAFVECGVWRGGASIFARKCLPVEREVVCCDSFQGLPSAINEPGWDFDVLKVGEQEVRENFNKYDALENVRFVKGWFKDTLKTLRLPIAILRADGDMYHSTVCILSNLYDCVSPGGYVIIDDYNLPVCRRAVLEFREQKNITSPFKHIDDGAVYWEVV